MGGGQHYAANLTTTRLINGVLGEETFPQGLKSCFCRYFDVGAQALSADRQTPTP
jgi:hypothetical protein